MIVRRNLPMISQGFVIRPFNPEDVDFIIQGQLELYEIEHGFSSDIWKAYITEGVQDLANQFDKQRDCIFILEYKGVPSGCAAIKHVDDVTAKFRFFFVNYEVRGWGAGSKLLDLAIDFCKEKGYKNVFLWTFSTLHPARHLYKSKGFKITETQENNNWGTVILEERWEMDL
jgi:GNAT superfamily N-acetyltransferase